MNSIYSKIAGLLIIFNIAVLGLFFSFDDYIPNQVSQKKEELQLKGNYFSKIIKPVLLTESISHFEKTIRIENLLGDKNLYSHEQLRIYKFDAKEYLSELFVYFDGEERGRLENLKATGLIQEKTKNQSWKEENLNIASKLFKFYQPLLNSRILTDPLVEKRSRFFHQTEVIQGKSENYRIRVVAPIRENSMTLGIIEIWEEFSIKEAYVNRNNARLIMLFGVSFITLLFGVFLAFSIARPIRKLSKRLDRKLTPDDIASQLKSFSDRKLKSRNDEVGLLYRNLNKLTSQISLLFEEKERFASEVSHELKNPIASIIANVENFTPKDDEDEAALNKIKEQAIRMNKLISEISEAAIVDNDLVTQSKERFDLSNTVTEIISHYSETNEYSELNLTSNIDKNVVLLGLPERIGQVLVNLLDNAISFSRPTGNINVQLKKKWRRKPLLVVEDSGPGVSEASAERIFDRFYTSRAGNSAVENASGLGLFICRQIIEAHGGTITVGQSALGGARFEVNF